jgi:5'-nucleotidase
MNIFMTNDDGYDSPMLLGLAKVLAPKHDITIVAPHNPQSGAGHSLTMHKPLRIKYFEDLSNDTGAKVYSCSGKPADCVKLGLDAIADKTPDLLISGINIGGNLGTDVLYSGTVAAALEGAFMGITSLATSLDSFELDHMDTAIKYVAEFIEKYPLDTIKKNTILNLNVPNIAYADIKGLKVVDLGIVKYTDIIAKGVDQWGRDFYWIGGQQLKQSAEKTDAYLVKQGYATLTPLTFIISDKTSMDDVTKTVESIFGKCDA